MYGNLKAFISRTTRSFKWLIWFFPRNPRLELYIRAMDRINRRFYANVLADKAKGVDTYLAQYHHQPLPKLIWTYWAQGADSTPYIVAKCFESWRNQNPDWKFHVLDETNVAEFADMSDIPPSLPFRYRANILRLRLLKQYGGVWVDSTTFCHRPLDEWLPLLCSTGFFVFSNPSEDRFVENWYIASTKDAGLSSLMVCAACAGLRMAGKHACACATSCFTPSDIIILFESLSYSSKIPTFSTYFKKSRTKSIDLDKANFSL